MSTFTPVYVHTRPVLTALVDEILQREHVALDTEFVSEGAYEPILCLIQIATEGGIWIVDPLTSLDTGPLWEAVTAPERELVVMAAREEIRFCLREAGRPPSRMFGAQIAGGLVGYGYPMSHTNLVRKVVGVQVQGGESFTDWRKRPLSAKQLEYAADDVRHLLAMRRKLLEEAAALDRVRWVEAECQRLVDRVEEGEKEERWRRVSGSTSLNRRDLAILRELWRWRDAEARHENSPPRRVMRDDMLIEIAKRRPVTTADLFALRGLERGSIRAAGPDIVLAVQRAMKLPDAELPAVLRRDDPPQVNILGQLLSVASNGLAEESRVDPQLLATTSDLQEVVRWRLGIGGVEGDPFLFEGWRGEILREPLTEILDGRRCARVANLKKPSPLIFEPHAGDPDL
ncbi:MAG: 3-5 exonuclease [Armatimonadetes bacterium]|nr:3-5 exonuclease [Armatimonadota bacterium]